MRKRILLSLVAILTLYCQHSPAHALAACGTDPPSVNGGLAWPAHGAVTNAWSLDCANDRGHRGIDVDIPKGTPVTASAPGTVIFTGFTPAEGGGTTVSLEHGGGLRTTYLHLSGTTVSEGQTVKRGELLGMSDGNPLHFGVKVVSGREYYFDPMVFLPPAVAETQETSSTVPEPSGDPAGSPVAAAPAATQDSPVAAEGANFAAEGQDVAGFPGTSPETVHGDSAAGVPALVVTTPSPAVVIDPGDSGAAGFDLPGMNSLDISPGRAGPVKERQIDDGPRAFNLARTRPPNLSRNGRAAPDGRDAPNDGLRGYVGSSSSSAGLGIGLCCLVLLIVLAGRGIGKMAAEPASC